MRYIQIISVSCLIVSGSSKEDDLDPIIRRIESLEESLKQKDTEIMELRERIEDVRADNTELRAENTKLKERIEDVRNPPFGYFCSYQDLWDSSASVITYDKILYSSHFGLQGGGIDINTGKFEAGFDGTWRVHFSLRTCPDPGEYAHIYLYKNGVQILETYFDSYHSSSGSGFESSTGGRSILLHLDVGDELSLRGHHSPDMNASNIIFCVSLEQFDV